MSLQTTKLRILKTGNECKRDEKNKQAWHLQWTCTGISHCEYAHTNVLKRCRAYDNPKIEHINDLRKKVHNQVSTDIGALIWAATDSRYHAIKDAWRRSPCQHPVTDSDECPETTLGVYEDSKRKVRQLSIPSAFLILIIGSAYLPAAPVLSPIWDLNGTSQRLSAKISRD